LSESDREAICLVAWEGLSNADAARAAGCSAATFDARISRARKRLARALDNPPVATFIVPERI
jgi:DNA-directed RNA polymerase specialized sigma24 family protein